MDNLCHTLTGAALGEAGLKRETRFGNVVLMIASNLPDLDVLIYATAIPGVAFRRGWTHGVLAQALLPVLLAAAFTAIDRWRPARGTAPPARARALLALSYLGVVVHVAMDWLNNYGVRLLKPFSDRWFYGDAVFIIDPWLWLLLGSGVFLARQRRSVNFARVAILLAGAYISAMVWSAQEARRVVLNALIAQRGRAPEALMVGPAAVDPFRKVVIADQGDTYDVGTFRWVGRRLVLGAPPTPTNQGDPAVVRAREHPRFRAVLVWARFPYYEVTSAPGGTRVTLRDMRFGDRVGSVSVIVDDE
jgi:inner membrane protein